MLVGRKNLPNNALAKTCLSRPPLSRTAKFPLSSAFFSWHLRLPLHEPTLFTFGAKKKWVLSQGARLRRAQKSAVERYKFASSFKEGLPIHKPLWGFPLVGRLLLNKFCFVLPPPPTLKDF